MRSFITLLSVLILIGGIFLAVTILVAPQIYAPIFCPQGYQISTRTTMTISGSSTSRNTTYICRGPDGEQQDVTGPYFISFFVVLLGSILQLVLMSVIFGTSRRRTLRSDPGFYASSVSNARVDALQQAYDRGAINASQYEQAKAAFGTLSQSSASNVVNGSTDALKKAYESGQLTAAQYEKALAALNMLGSGFQNPGVQSFQVQMGTSPAPNLTLSDKLNQLKEAYDKGLLNSDEYEAQRKQILKDFS